MILDLAHKKVFLFISDCLSFETSYRGFGDFKSIANISTAEKCQDECADDDRCKVWEWVDANARFNLPSKSEDLGRCLLKDGAENGQIVGDVEERVSKMNPFSPILAISDHNKDDGNTEDRI